MTIKTSPLLDKLPDNESKAREILALLKWLSSKRFPYGLERAG